MKISFHGAARSVTGSRHVIDAGQTRVLFDCGMFQGRRDQARERNRHLGFDPKSIDAVCLSHAHIDHSGALPMLAKEGYNGEVDPIPIFIDSPLALKATKVFRQHPECYDKETYRTFTSTGDVFAAKYINFVSTAKDSKLLNRRKGPCVIISASGMCEGGRVVHHLKHSIEDEANVIVFVGFQAEHTLGRKLVEEWDTVPIFGVPTRRRAQVVRLNGFSAHADRNDLLAYVRAITPHPQKVFVVHGEERQSLAFAMTLRDEFPGMEVEVPKPESTHDV
jgi:metallo-beta-lactamase family protein